MIPLPKIFLKNNELRAKHDDRVRSISEFENSLVYNVSAREARTIIRRPCLKEQKLERFERLD